jgi:hypothetical protein
MEYFSHSNCGCECECDCECECGEYSVDYCLSLGNIVMDMNHVMVVVRQPYGFIHACFVRISVGCG